MWTAGFTNVTVAGQVGVWQVSQGGRHGVSLGVGGGLQGNSYVYNLFILRSNQLGVFGVVMTSPHSHVLGARPTAASLLISGMALSALLTWAAVEKTGSATFLAAWVAQVRSQTQTVGETLTNAAIREVLKIYYQTYWYFREQLI